MSLRDRQENTALLFTDYFEVRDGVRVRSNLNLWIKRALLLPLALYGGSSDLRWLNRTVMQFGNPVCCPSVTINRGVVGDFSFSTELSINLDWDAWLRIIMAGHRIAYHRKLLVGHRIHEETETSVGILERRRESDDRAILERLWPQCLVPYVVWLYKKGYHSNSL